MTKAKLLLLMCSVLAAAPALRADQPSVHIRPTNLDGPRVLNDQTRESVIRNYLEAWQSVSAAMQQNRPQLLDRDFVGTAKDKLTDTIQSQATMGMSTRYQERSHDVQIVFYSPEGLSIQLVDTVEYDVQIFDKGKAVGTPQALKARYLVVLTPAQTRWRVRIFQTESE